MRKTDEQIKAKRRERFEYHVVRLAKYLNLANVDEYADLPGPLKEHFNSMHYGQVVAPLIQKEAAEGYKPSELAIKYGLCETAIRNHINNKKERLQSV